MSKYIKAEIADQFKGGRGIVSAYVLIVIASSVIVAAFRLGLQARIFWGF